MTAILIINNMIINGIFPLQEPEVSAEAETFIRVIRRGKTIGKLSIAISEKLFEALEAMAAIMVRTDERPRLPRISAVKNSPGFWIIFPIRSTKKKSASTDKIDISTRLYKIFDSTMDSGLVMV